MIDRALFRSAGFRFGAVYALLLAFSATALALFLWWATAGLLDRQTEAAISADAQGLSEHYADGGLPALVVTIEERLAQNIDDDAIYLLTDPAMKRLAGNLAGWPPSVANTGESASSVGLWPKASIDAPVNPSSAAAAMPQARRVPACRQR